MADRRRPLEIDWYLFFIRWPVFILVLAVHFLFVSLHADSKVLYGALVVGVSCNLVCLLFLLSNLYTSIVAVLAHVVDIGVLLAILYATGLGNSPYYVLAAIPVVGGTLRFGRIGGLATAFVLAVGYGSMVVLSFGRALPVNLLLVYVLSTAILCLLAVLPRMRPGSMQALDKYHDTQGKVGVNGSHEAHERLKTVYELTRTLSATLNYEHVLNTILDSTVMNLSKSKDDDSQIVRMVLLYSPKRKLEIVASRNLLPSDRSLPIGDQAGLVHQAITSAEPVISQGVGNDPELQQFASLSGARSLLCMPLRAAFEIYGAVLLASPQANAFQPEHVELIAAFCNQAVIALQNARLYQDLELDRQRVIDTQEEIRRQLARELHDGPTQAVSAIAMRLNFTKLLVTREPTRAAAELEKLEELARKTAKEIRTMLFALRPLALETQGLTVALEQYAEKLRETEGLIIHVDSALDERLPAKTEGIAFSIIEEAVNNARKHARAENVYVRLRLQQDLLVAEVEDDGCGFDLSSVETRYDQRDSLGLINMKERAALVSGNLTIKSEPGKGTQITLLIPLSDTGLKTR